MVRSAAIREAAYGDACALRARRETEVLLEERVREKRRTRPLFYALLLGGTALCAAAGLFAGMLLSSSAAAYTFAEDVPTELLAEIKRLKSELQQARADVEILQEAVGFFAKSRKK